MTDTYAENDAIDVVAAWVASYSATWNLPVIKAIGDFPATGDYAVADIDEGEGLSGTIEGALAWDATISVVIAIIFDVEGASLAARVAAARHKFGGLRKHILTEGGTIIQSFTSMAPMILSDTDVRRGQFAAQLTLSLYAQP